MSSCAVPAVDSCVMLTTRLYIVVKDGSSGGLSIPRMRRSVSRSSGFVVCSNLFDHSHSRMSTPFNGKLTMVGFFSSTKLFDVKRLMCIMMKGGSLVSLYCRNLPALSCVVCPLNLANTSEIGT